MLTEQAVKLIQDTAVKADGKRIIKPEAEPKHVYFIQQDDGSLEKRFAESGPVDYEAHSFETLAQLAADAPVPPHSAIWYSTSGVTVTFDETLRDRANLPLSDSTPFAKLTEWNGAGVNGVLMDHISTFTMFRTLFRDCLPAHSSLRDDIKKAQEAASGVSRTAVSMSKSLIAEASGADKLPEVLTFDVPVFAEAYAPVRALVRVAFDLEPQQERFRFIVLPGEIEKAQAVAEEWLHGAVNAALAKAEPTEPVSVYCGIP